MRASPLSTFLFILWLAAVPARAADDADEWRMFGNVLTLVQHFVRIAAQSEDPQAVQKGMDAMLSGQSPEANRVAGEIVNEMLRDMPAEYRGKFLSMARDFMTIARRDHARAVERGDAHSIDRALQARKELHAMGLRYWDEQQFLDAVQRGDTIAVDLYLAARGLKNPPAAR